MKRIFGLAAVAVIALGMNAQRAAGFTSFTPGNIIVFRVGDGTQVLTNTGNSAFLDEYSTNGSFVQTLPMPTNWYGANAPLISFGSGFAQGEMTLSQDGRFLLVPGFGATLGQDTNFAIYSVFASNQIPRVVGVVDAHGNINTTTAQTNTLVNAEEIRSAASTDGTNLWFSGDSTGIKATTVGSGVCTQVEKSSTNIRQINIYSNQLYFTTSTGIRDATNPPLPFVTNALVTILPGTITNNTAPFGFAMFNLNGGSTPDTLYVCDGTVTYGGESPGVVEKYALVSGNWINSGSIGAANATFITGVQNGPNVTLFITDSSGSFGNNALFSGVDSSGFNGDPGGSADWNVNGHAKLLAPVGGTFGIRGIAMAPTANQPLSGGPNVCSVGPVYKPSFIGPFGGPFSTVSPTTNSFSVANFGTASFTYSFNPASAPWLSASPASAPISVGGSITVTVTPNANATTLSPGLHSGTFAFAASPGGSVGRFATIQVNALSIAPSTNWLSTGSVGGPFSPPSQVYVISNTTPNIIGWAMSVGQPWSSVNGASVVTGTLAVAATTNITYTVNTAANTLGVGIYNDTISLSNQPPPAAAAQVAAIQINLAVGFGIFDDYSTYTQNQNLSGQNGWIAFSSPARTLIRSRTTRLPCWGLVAAR